MGRGKWKAMKIRRQLMSRRGSKEKRAKVSSRSTTRNGEVSVLGKITGDEPISGIAAEERTRLLLAWAPWSG